MRITKKYRTELARSIIDRNVMNLPFSTEDATAMNGALGTSFEGFVRRRNPQYPSDPRHLHGSTFGEFEAFSWLKAISPVSDIQDTKKVMREAIAPCLSEFMDSQDEPACEHCGTTERLTVDHNPHFDGIALAYLADHAMPRIIDSPNGVGNIFESIDVEARWIEFHASKITRYAILCRSCNASKGKTDAVRKAARPTITQDLSVGADAEAFV
jgi:hypothetical protein